MSRDFFIVTGQPNDGRPVHMVRRHPETDRVGGWATPREHTRTACEKTWAAGHPTQTVDLVTCPECLTWCVANPEKFTMSENGGIVYERLLDGGTPFWPGEPIDRHPVTAAEIAEVTAAEIRRDRGGNRSTMNLLLCVIVRVKGVEHHGSAVYLPGDTWLSEARALFELLPAGTSLSVTASAWCASGARYATEWRLPAKPRRPRAAPRPR